MTNAIKFILTLFQPRAKMLYCPMLPEYLRLDDGTDLDWIIQYKRNAFAKWRYFTTLQGIPINYSKKYAKNIVKLIKEQKVYL